MKAFSIDLRQRIIAAFDAKEGTQKQVAQRFRVSIDFVGKLLRQRRNTNSIDPKPHGGGRTRVIDTQASQRLRQAVAENNDATLAQLAAAAGVQASPSMVHRALKDLDITRKKSLIGRPSKTVPS